MALNPVDREVLNTAFGMSSAANEPLNPDAVRSKLGGIKEEDFYVSLDDRRSCRAMQRTAPRSDA